MEEPQEPDYCIQKWDCSVSGKKNQTQTALGLDFNTLPKERPAPAARTAEQRAQARLQLPVPSGRHFTSARPRRS